MHICLLNFSYRIKHKKNETAVLGGNVTIFCNWTAQEDVVQITWQKIQDSSPQNIGTYSSKYGEKILPPYVDRLHCKILEPNSSFITIQKVTFEDEACYKCLFNVFPHGSHGGEICLNILTVSNLTNENRFISDSEGSLELIYSAVGKPAPQISLFPSQVLMNRPKEYLDQSQNGTVTVTKIYTVSLETVRFLGLQHLIVHMDHPLRNEERIVPLSTLTSPFVPAVHSRIFFLGLQFIRCISLSLFFFFFLRQIVVMVPTLALSSQFFCLRLLSAGCKSCFYFYKIHGHFFHCLLDFIHEKL
uniref:Ig-like domain-containing protein n=1 Tax=Castor canadensis TaxID=51338 RepID=A0A8C0WHR9_CASCN